MHYYQYNHIFARLFTFSLTLLLLQSLCYCHSISLDKPNTVSDQSAQASVSVDFNLKDESHAHLNLQTNEDLKKLLHLPFDGLVTLHIKTLHKHFTLLLRKNTFLLSQNFVTKFYELDPSTQRQYPVEDYSFQNGTKSIGLFFTGSVLDSTGSVASFHIHYGYGIDGVMETSQGAYHVLSKINGERYIHFITLENDSAFNVGEPVGCGTEDAKHFHRHHHHGNRIKDRTRQRRASSKRLPTGSNADTRFIEIYLVMDYASYLRYNDIDQTAFRGINIMNYASARYRELNIYLAVVGLEVWNRGSKINLPSVDNITNRVTSAQALEMFLEYRSLYITPNTPNDNAQLLAGIRFSDVIGRATTGVICSEGFSGGVNVNTSPGFRYTATTLVHELGHNLGLTHDDSIFPKYEDWGCNTLCPVQPGDPEGTIDKCIMFSTSISSYLYTRWSECAKLYMERTIFEYDNDYCLYNIPDTLESVGNTPVCGNFFTEEGEECDCGLPGDCTNACCDPSTCRRSANATCAAGNCCDIETCQLHPLSYPCRPRIDESCDFAEFCDGESEWCPDDTYKHHGYSCTKDDGDAYCYHGKCKSHESQCISVFGQGTTRAGETCYKNNYAVSQSSGEGQYYANCGFYQQYNSSGDYISRYKVCETEEDGFCGMLHCSAPESLRTYGGRFTFFYFRLYVLGYYNDDQWSPSDCDFVLFDVGLTGINPGLVPDGAKCGDNKHCVNSRCVDVPSLPDKCNCSGHGSCDQNGNCYCDIGWDPPFCGKRGKGGSETSSPPVQYGESMRTPVGLITFFGGVIPLCVIIGVVCYLRRHDLKLHYAKLRTRFNEGSGSKLASKLKTNTDKENPAGPDHPPASRNISHPVLQSTTNHVNKGQTIKREKALVPSRDPPSIPINKRHQPSSLNPTYSTANEPKNPALKPTKGSKSTPERKNVREFLPGITETPKSVVSDSKTSKPLATRVTMEAPDKPLPDTPVGHHKYENVKPQVPKKPPKHPKPGA